MLSRIVDGVLKLAQVSIIVSVTGLTGYVAYNHIAHPVSQNPPAFVDTAPLNPPITLPVVSPTSVPPGKTVSAKSSDPLVSCMGPDGKIAKLTRAECESFSRAWGQRTIIIGDTSVGPTSIPSGSSSSSTNVYCYNNITHTSYYVSSGEKCNSDNERSMCFNAWQLISDQCSAKCKTTNDNGYAACVSAYTGTSATIIQDENKYNACESENMSNYSNCLSTCTAQYTQNIKSCN